MCECEREGEREEGKKQKSEQKVNKRREGGEEEREGGRDGVKERKMVGEREWVKMKERD